MLDETFNSLTGRYYALDVAPAVSYRWRINIPDDPQFIAAIKELIEQMASPEVWLERDTSIRTQDECAAIAMEMYHSFRKDDSMLGWVVPFATYIVPHNMLLCDGATYSKDDYPDLWQVINSNLVLDSTTFKTPDLRGRFIMADGDTDHPEYSIGGEYQHGLVVGELPFHQHTTNPHSHTYATGTWIDTLAGVDPLPASYITPFGGLTGDSGYQTDNGTGADEPHENTPPYFVLRYGIVAKVG